MSIQISVATLAQGFDVQNRNNAQARWNWCHQVKGYCAGAEDGKVRELKKEIGVKVAEKCGKAAPYSVQWVDAQIRAATKYPQKPTTSEECTDFLNTANLVSSAKAAAKGAPNAPGTKDDALTALKAAVLRAHKRGATDNEICDIVNAALATPAPTAKKAA